MLVRCDKVCKTMRTCSLDEDNNIVVCDSCGQELDYISEYAKISLRQNKKVLKKNKRKAFVFKCNFCKKNVECEKEGTRVIGKGCVEKKCKINISKFMKVAIDEVSKGKERDSEPTKDPSSDL